MRKLRKSPMLPTSDSPQSLLDLEADGELSSYSNTFFATFPPVSATLQSISMVQNPFDPSINNPEISNISASDQSTNVAGTELNQTANVFANVQLANMQYPETNVSALSVNALNPTTLQPQYVRQRGLLIV